MVIVISIIPNIMSPWSYPAIYLIWTAFQVFKIVNRKRIAVKKPLVFTARAKRLFGLSLALLVVAAVMLVYFINEESWRIGIFLFSELTVPILVVSSFLILAVGTINQQHLFT